MGWDLGRHPAPSAAGQHATAGRRALTGRAAGPAVTVGEPRGLDVSSYQGNVRWERVKAHGASFAYVKATQSTDYVNPYFSQQYNGAYDAGLVRGAYTFATPNTSTGAAQANYFVSHGGGWSADGKTLPGMLDIEYNPYGRECYGLTPSAMVRWIKSFSNEYQALTRRWPVIYSTTQWWSTCTGNRGNFSSTNPLMIANYSASPYPLAYAWQIWTIWQYNDSGTFPGDQDRFNGPLSGLRRLASDT